MTVLVWTLAVAAVLALAWAAVLSSARVRRLHRLHIRTDAARDGLRSALDRRAGAALAVATLLAEAPGRPAEVAGALRAGVAAARTAGALDADREAAENVLGRALAAVDRAVLPAALCEELADAEQLVVLARYVHNDAVRDTLALRSRRLVRLLRLAGTAPMPGYFEIADAPSGVPAGVTTAARASAPERRVAPPR